MMNSPEANSGGDSSTKPEGATGIFVLGLLGLLLCQILGIIAWVQGNGYLRQCQAQGVEPEGLAVAGRVLGIISVVLLILGVGMAILVGVIGLLGAGS